MRNFKRMNKFVDFAELFLLQSFQLYKKLKNNDRSKARFCEI